jgi:hypothetical protein
MCDNENILINTFHKLSQAAALLACTQEAPSSNLGPVTIMTKDFHDSPRRFLLNAVGPEISNDPPPPQSFRIHRTLPCYHSTLHNLHSRYGIVN